MVKVKRYKRLIDRRKVRIRSKIKGTLERPRLSVFRSNRYIYVQAIDDSCAQTFASGFGSKKESFALGEDFGKKLFKKGVREAALDRGGYKYHGVVKKLSEGIRKGGIQF